MTTTEPRTFTTAEVQEMLRMPLAEPDEYDLLGTDAEIAEVDEQLRQVAEIQARLDALVAIAINDVSTAVSGLGYYYQDGMGCYCSPTRAAMLRHWSDVAPEEDLSVTYHRWMPKDRQTPSKDLALIHAQIDEDDVDLSRWAEWTLTGVGCVMMAAGVLCSVFGVFVG